MFSLQTALDERLAVLKNRKVLTKQSVKVNNISKEYIQEALKQAGILSQNGKMIKRLIP